jgi:hypothetical protein
MKTIGYYRAEGFGEFTLPTSGAIAEHGWQPVVTRADAEQTSADLLAALEMLVAAQNKEIELGVRMTRAQWNQARAAIAKAKGEA